MAVTEDWKYWEQFSACPLPYHSCNPRLQAPLEAAGPRCPHYWELPCQSVIFCGGVCVWEPRHQTAFKALPGPALPTDPYRQSLALERCTMQIKLNQPLVKFLAKTKFLQQTWQDPFSHFQMRILRPTENFNFIAQNTIPFIQFTCLASLHPSVLCSNVTFLVVSPNTEIPILSSTTISFFLTLR